MGNLIVLHKFRPSLAQAFLNHRCVFLSIQFTWHFVVRWHSMPLAKTDLVRPDAFEPRERWRDVLYRASPSSNRENLMPLSLARRSGLILVILFFCAGGIAHFAFAAAETQIIPPYIAYPQLVNYAAGVLEILGAFGLMIQWTRRVAGYGLMLLTVCVTPANVFMLQHADLYPGIPVWALVIRLPLQFALLALIGWSSRV